MTGLAAALAVLLWLWATGSGGRDAARRAAPGPDAAGAPGAAGRDGDASGGPGGGTRPPAPWTLRVLVVRRDEPVPGARVEAFGPEQGAAWIGVRPATPTPVAAGVTGADGVARLPARHAGHWQVVALHPDFAPGIAAATVAAPPGEHALVVRLRPGAALRGRVLDESGRPVAGVTVRAGRALVYGPGHNATVRTRTDAAGRYAFHALPNGRLQLAPGDPPGHPITVQLPFRGECDLVLRPTGALAGRITDVATGRALAGVRVRVEARGSIGYDRTGDDGRYRCGFLRPGKVARIAVAKEGYVPLHESGVVGPPDGSLPRSPTGPRGRVALAIPIRADEVTTYDIGLRRGARVHGVVRGPDGPLAGARVSLTTGKGQNGYLVAPVESGADGRYAFPGVLAGPALVIASKEGYVHPDDPGAWWSQALRGARPCAVRVVVPATGDVELDPSLARGWTLAGRVESDAGAPVGGALVFAHQGRPVERSRMAHSGAGGAFAIDGLVPGHAVRVSAGGPGWQRGDLVDVAADTAAPVVLRVLAARLVRGRVTDATGAPVADATIDLLVQRQRAPGPMIVPTVTLTGPDGRYERERPGGVDTVQVRAEAPGYLPAVSPATDADEVDLVLDRGVTVRGRVRDAAGAPVARAQVRITGPDARGYTWHLPVVAATGADGAFQVGAVSATRVRILVSAPGFRPADLTARPDGPPIEITLAPAHAIAGAARLRDGTPAAGATIAAVPVGDRRWDVYWITRPQALRSDGIPGRVEAVTDAEGRFRLADLDGGEVRLVVMPGGPPLRPVREHRVRAPADGVVLTVAEVEPGPHATLSDDDLGRAAQYMTIRGEPAKSADLWRALLGRELDTGTRVEASLGLARALRETGKGHEERETVLRDAARLAPAATSAGLRVRYQLARAIHARGRHAEALELAREVERGSAVDANAAAGGGLVVAQCLAALGRVDEARAKLDAVAAEANRLGDASLAVLVRNARRAIE